MLDDLKIITNRDKHEALTVALKQPEQLLKQFDVQLPSMQISSVCLAGMGGSALAARASLDWPGMKVPTVVHTEYGLPGFVNAKTLVVITSYSGNTAEALSMYEAAQDAGAHIVVITSGGKLKEQAFSDGIRCVIVPDGIMPRLAVFYMYRALLEVLEAAGVADGAVRQLEAVAVNLHYDVKNWAPDVPSSQNLAKRLAMEAAGKSAVIYGAEHLKAAAYLWKISLNENAKNLAFYNYLPEMNHNELIGWTSHPHQKLFTVIELLSKDYAKDIQKRFELMNAQLSGKMPAPQKIMHSHGSKLEQMLWSMSLATFVGLYLAIVNNVDPTEIKVLEQFKNKLEH